MSWKRIVTAGLFCVLASPVFAQPKLEIRSAGLDPATGDMLWNVRLAPNAAGDAMATELGFDQTAGSGLTKATIQSTTVAATGLSWQQNNPAAPIFTWETTYGTPPFPEGLEVNCPTCTPSSSNNANAQNPVAITVNNPGHDTTVVSSGSVNQIFSAMGGNLLAAGDLSSGPALPTLIGASQTGLANSTAYMQIRTKSPTVSTLTSTIQLTGSHDGANKSGRVADVNGANFTNYKGFTGSASLTLKAGDINLDGFTDNSDFNIFVGKYNPGVGIAGKWAVGDFNSDGFVDNSDFNIFVGGYNPGVGGGSYSPLVITTATADAGAGAGSSLSDGGSVPEPASIALLGLALLGGLGIIRRKR